MVHRLPRTDTSYEISLVVGQLRVLGPFVVEERVSLLVNQDESKLHKLRSLGLCIDLLIAFLAEELIRPLADADQ